MREPAYIQKTTLRIAAMAGFVLLGIMVLSSIPSLGPVPYGLIGLAAVVLRGLSRASDDPFAMRPPMLPVGMSAVVLFFLGNWIDSSYLQWFSLGLLAIGWLSQSLDRRLLGGICLLVLLICLPRGLVNDFVLQGMQRLAAHLASWALDLAGIPHLRQGVVIEMPGRCLFVEQACSGMQSLVTGLIVAQIYFAWNQKSVPFCVAGLFITGVLLLTGNSLRVFAMAWFWHAAEIDLTGGWRHDLGGMIIYLFVILMLPGTGHLLDALFRLVSPARLISSGDPRMRETGPVRPDFEPARAWSCFSSRIPVSAGVFIAVMLCIFMMERMVFARVIESPANAESASLRGFEMPRELAGWQRADEGREVDFIEGFGLEQHVWTYRKGPLRAWVAANLPFDHMHQLSACYINRGWVITGEDIASPDGVAPFSRMYLRSKEGDRAPMLVLFDNFSLRENRFTGGLPGRFDSRRQRIIQRLRGQPGRLLGEGGLYCQLQILMPGVDGADSPSSREAILLLDSARAALSSRMAMEANGPES